MVIIALLIQYPFKNEKEYEYIPIYEPLAGVWFGHIEKITPDKGPAPLGDYSNTD